MKSLFRGKIGKQNAINNLAQTQYFLKSIFFKRQVPEALELRDKSHKNIDFSLL